MIARLDRIAQLEPRAAEARGTHATWRLTLQ